MSFVGDLEVGREYENRILEYLAKSYPNMRLAKNPNKLGIDLVSPLGVNVEVKFDRMMGNTGNIFIEYECNGKASGIYKYDNLHLFAYGNNEIFYLFNANKLRKDIKKMLETKEYRIIAGGDGWRSKGILIPIRDLIGKTIAARQFRLA